MYNSLGFFVLAKKLSLKLNVQPWDDNTVVEGNFFRSYHDNSTCKSNLSSCKINTHVWIWTPIKISPVASNVEAHSFGHKLQARHGIYLLQCSFNYKHSKKWDGQQMRFFPLWSCVCAGMTLVPLWPPPTAWSSHKTCVWEKVISQDS